MRRWPAATGPSACLANQALHDESESLEQSGRSPTGGAGHRVRAASRPCSIRRSMIDWASHITVPVFLSGALQDEQTGPQWPALIDAFPKSTKVFANMVNGDHIDSTDPQTISRWLEFLDIYVARKVPTQPNALGGHRPRRVHQLRLRRVGPGPAAGHPVHRGHERGPGRKGVRGPDAPGAGAVRQRRRQRRAR